MADHLAGGRLAEILQEKANAGVPWEVVSRHLYADFAVDVTGQTLRRWVHQMSIVATSEAVAG